MVFMHTLALGFGNFGGPDLIIVLVIVFVLFGAKNCRNWREV
jgi:Sec-independent protein translocase protein TatA